MTTHIHKQKAYLRGVVLAVDITETIELEKMNCAPDGYLRHMLAHKTDSDVSLYRKWKRDRLWSTLSAEIQDLNRVIAEEWPIGTNTAVGSMYRVRSLGFKQVHDLIQSQIGFDKVSDPESMSFVVGKTNYEREVRLTNLDARNGQEILIDYEFEKGHYIYKWGMDREEVITIKESQLRLIEVDNTLCVIAPGHNRMITRQLFEGVYGMAGGSFVAASEIDGFVDYKQEEIVLWYRGLSEYQLKTLRSSDSLGKIGDITLNARDDQDLDSVVDEDERVESQLNDSKHKSKVLMCNYMHENGFLEKIKVYLTYRNDHLGVGFSRGISYSGRLRVMRDLLELRNE